VTVEALYIGKVDLRVLHVRDENADETRMRN